MKTITLLAGACLAALIAGAASAQTPMPAAAPAKPVAPAAAPAPAQPASGATPATPAAAPAATTVTTAQVVAKGDLIDTLASSGQFNTFIKALTAANLVGVVKSHPGLTVFAPTDAAFAALPAGQLDALMKNPAALQKLLAYHLVNTTVDSAKIKGAKGPVKTVANADLELDGSGTNLMVNTATITQADVKTTGGGTIQVIDKVLDPAGGATAPAATPPAPPPATPDPGDDQATPPKPSDATPSDPPEKPDPTPKG